MKLALHVFSSVEDSGCPSAAYIEITPAHAASILALRSAAFLFRSAHGADVCQYMGISVGSGPGIPKFQLSEVASEISDAEVYVLPSTFSVEENPNGESWAVDFHRILLSDTGVIFSAQASRSSADYDTVTLSISCLEQIAQGKDVLEV